MGLVPMELIAMVRSLLEGTTAAPWEFDDHEDSAHDSITVGAGTYLDSPGHYTATDLIHEVDTYGLELDSKDYARIVADAKLIAAAPVLIKALADALERTMLKSK